MEGFWHDGEKAAEALDDFEEAVLFGEGLLVDAELGQDLGIATHFLGALFHLLLVVLENISKDFDRLERLFVLHQMLDEKRIRLASLAFQILALLLVRSNHIRDGLDFAFGLIDFALDLIDDLVLGVPFALLASSGSGLLGANPSKFLVLGIGLL